MHYLTKRAMTLILSHLYNFYSHAVTVSSFTVSFDQISVLLLRNNSRERGLLSKCLHSFLKWRQELLYMQLCHIHRPSQSLFYTQKVLCDAIIMAGRNKKEIELRTQEVQGIRNSPLVRSKERDES